MKMRKLLALLTLLGITASCTNEQDVKITQETQPGEIQIMFNGNGAQAEYPDTRAIASDVENQIDKLDVYVFASDTENGTYYFVEKWSKGDADDTATKTFALQGAGVNRKASIFPTEYKGYPYLKLYCVANGDLYEADGKKAVTPVALTVKGDGTIDNTGATKSTDMETYSPGNIKDDAPIATPLPMAGVAGTMITTDYSLITVEMVRRVARFDIVNNASTTNFTITKITPLNVRPTHLFFKETYTGTAMEKYPEVDYTKLSNANNGTTPAAFYVFPTSKADQMTLLIEGNYSGTPVAYNVKVALTPEPTVAIPNPKAAYIDVKTNNRYTLRIKDVREAGLTVLFEIEDWILGGGMIVQPDNGSKPEVLEIANHKTTPAFKEVVDDTIKINNNGTFTIKATANGATHAIITPIAPGKTTPWITTDNAAADKTVVLTEDGMKQTKLTFTTANTTAVATGGQKALITLINAAAPDDSAFKKTYIAALPELKGPSISWNAAIRANEYANYIDNTDPENPILYWYKANSNNACYLKINSYYDISTTITKVSNIGSFTLPSYSANSKTLNITTSSMTPALSTVDGDLILTNLVDKNAKTTLHIKYIVPKTVTTTVSGSHATLNGTTCEIDVDSMTEGVDNSFEFTTVSSEGTKIPTNAPAWLTITEKTPFDRVTGETVYTMTVDKSAGASYTQTNTTFIQAIKSTTSPVITFKKK